MADEPGATPAPTPATPATPEPAPTPTPEPGKQEPAEDAPLGESGEKALEAFKARAKDAEKKAKDLEARVEEFENRDKSELQKAQGERDKAKVTAAEATTKALRLEVAVEKSLPSALVPALTGKDKAAMETHADELLKLVKDNGGSTPDFDGGAREPAPKAETPEQAHNNLVLRALGAVPPSNT